MTACCQINRTIPWLSCEQLPCLPEHPRFSRIQQRDKSEMPLLTLPYKYFLPRHSSSTLSFHSFQTYRPGGGIVRETQELQQGSPPTILRAFDLFILSGRNGHQLHRPWGQFSITFLLFTILLIFCTVIYLVFSLFLFPVFSTFKPLGIDRENCYPHRPTPLSMPWSTGKSRSYRFDKCRNKYDPL